MHEMVDLLRCTQDQFLPTLCFVFLNSLLAMHNCRWKGKKNIVDNFSCVSARSINTFFFCLFFFSEEQLEEDKFHSNGGKVLSSELRKHSLFRFYFRCLRFCLVPTESWVSVEVGLCYDSCSFALFCFGALLLSFFTFFASFIHASQHNCSTNCKVNSSSPKLGLDWWS